MFAALALAQLSVLGKSEWECACWACFQPPESPMPPRLTWAHCSSQRAAEGLSRTREKELCKRIKTKRRDLLSSGQVLQLYYNWQKQQNGKGVTPLSHFLKACYFMERQKVVHNRVVIPGESSVLFQF